MSVLRRCAAESGDHHARPRRRRGHDAPALAPNAIALLGPFDQPVGIPSVAIDSNGTLHVVHSRADEAAMDHAWSNDGASRETELVDYPASEALQRIDLAAGPSATLQLAMTGP